MALRLVGHDNLCVTSLDVYNLHLLVHHFRGTDWAQHVLPFLGFRVFTCSVAANQSKTCAISEAGQLASSDLEYDLPPDLGPVVAVAAGGAVGVVGGHHTCAVKASGELVCFGCQDQCDVPPDLGAVVAVAAGVGHTCAVKASGELVCFGWHQLGLCHMPPGFTVLLAPQSIRTPTPDPLQDVLQLVHHSDLLLISRKRRPEKPWRNRRLL